METPSNKMGIYSTGATDQTRFVLFYLSKVKILKKRKMSERENIEVYWQAPRGILALLSCSTVKLARVC